MKYFLLFHLIFANILYTFSQEILNNDDGNKYLLNPSFEILNGCPIAAGEFNLCQSWYCPWIRETPDYFCIDCDSLANNIILDNLDSKDGNCFVRIIIRYWKYYSAQEHIQTKLLSSLKTGEKYKLSFYMRTGEESSYFTDRIAVALTVDSLESYDYVNKKRYYMIGFKEAKLIKDVEIEFIAEGDEKFLTVGIFANNLKGYKREKFYRTYRGDSTRVGYYDLDMFELIKVE